MKIITLNVWGGKLYEPLMEFIKQHSADTDIFCFQDALFGSEPVFSPIEKGRINLCDEIAKVLLEYDHIISKEPEHSAICGEKLDPSVGAGKVVFYRKSLVLLESGEFNVADTHRTDSMVASKCQWLKFERGDREMTVLNLHGIWQRGSNKKDTEERIEQSKRIKKFMDAISGSKILCGDFNMVPDGVSMAILEEGMVNLVKNNNIISTRSSYYPKEERFADYVIVSPDIEVLSFEVLPDEVSDHLALSVVIK